jgi:hypothetical protein
MKSFVVNILFSSGRLSSLAVKLQGLEISDMVISGSMLNMLLRSYRPPNRSKIICITPLIGTAMMYQKVIVYHSGCSFLHKILPWEFITKNKHGILGPLASFASAYSRWRNYRPFLGKLIHIDYRAR